MGSNMHRLERLIDQLDTRASSRRAARHPGAVRHRAGRGQHGAEAVRVQGSRGPASAPGGFAPSVSPGSPAGRVAAASAAGQEAGGAVTLSQIIPDERTNKLIIVASPAAFERIQQLVREMDVPTNSGEGRINVYSLENANAEDLASTLQTLAQGTANRPAHAGDPGSRRRARSPAGARHRRRAVLRRGEGLRGQGHQLAGDRRQPVGLQEHRSG